MSIISGDLRKESFKSTYENNQFYSCNVSSKIEEDEYLFDNVAE